MRGKAATVQSFAGAQARFVFAGCQLLRSLEGAHPANLELELFRVTLLAWFQIITVLN